MSKFAKILTIILISAVVVAVVATLLQQKETSLGAGAVRDEIIPLGLIAEVNNTSSSTLTYTIPFGINGHRTGSLQFINMANAVVDLYMSNASDISPSTGTREFSDVSTDLIGAANFSSNRYVFIDTPIIGSYLRVVITTSTSATSTVNIYGVFSSK